MTLDWGVSVATKARTAEMPFEIARRVVPAKARVAVRPLPTWRRWEPTKLRVADRALVKMWTEATDPLNDRVAENDRRNCLPLARVPLKVREAAVSLVLIALGNKPEKASAAETALVMA